MEELTISGTDRAQLYRQLIPQIKGLVEGETSLIANLANVAAALKQTFGFFWVGFYIVQGDELVLGPFQGEIACTRISLGKGVCGTCWSEKKSVLVPNVEEFPGHIACSAKSKSEVVVPIIKSGNVVGVLDVDSSELNDFSEADVEGLEQIVALINQQF